MTYHVPTDEDWMPPCVICEQPIDYCPGHGAGGRFIVALCVGDTDHFTDEEWDAGLEDAIEAGFLSPLARTAPRETLTSQIRAYYGCGE